MTTPVVLTSFQKSMLLSICVYGSRIVDACYFRKEYLPCPVRVTVELPDGSTQIVVLRLARHGEVDREARLLSVLSGVGLPVPAVLAGPAANPDAPARPHVAVYSLLPGINLQQLSERSAQDCKMAARLVVDGARQLALLTEELRAALPDGVVPTISLRDHLGVIEGKGGTWLQRPEFVRAMQRLDKILDHVPQETVFTNGDYQPGNFLTDGMQVTGFVDFELARYQDFLFGFAKYPIYDMHPLNKGGFVEFLLEQERVERRDFHIRLALGCLITLQREIPITGGDAGYRSHVLALLDRSCEDLA